MNAPASRPGQRVWFADGERWVEASDGAGPFRIVSWHPPRMLLARGDEVRAFFVAPTADGSGVWLGGDGRTEAVLRPKRGRSSASAQGTTGHEDLTSPMPGKVLAVLVAEGDPVSAGQRLVIVEAMKMENPLRAPHDSVVTRLHVKVGDNVVPGDPIIELDRRDSHPVE
ncbi:MAG: acetyl-CoA carboxylase biotin carboxyl carrier protein subunit [Planctomycetota bacterium]